MPPGVFNVVTGDAEDAPAIGGELTSNPIGAQARLHRLDRGREAPDGASAPTRSRRSRSSSAATRRSSSSTTPTSTPRSPAALVCKFRNSGQTCISANRMLVQDGIYDAFVARFTAARRAARRSADGFDRGRRRRPADRRAGGREGRGARRGRARRAAPSSCVGGDARARRAVLRADGPRPASRRTCDVAARRRSARSPAIARFDDEEEAIRVANDTPYGLAAYFYTPRPRPRRGASARRSSTASSGSTPGLVSTEVAPFGGVKESGIGREGSRYGIDDWVEIKYWAIGGLPAR